MLDDGVVEQLLELRPGVVEASRTGGRDARRDAGACEGEAALGLLPDEGVGSVYERHGVEVARRADVGGEAGEDGPPYLPCPPASTVEQAAGGRLVTRLWTVAAGI